MSQPTSCDSVDYNQGHYRLRSDFKPGSGGWQSSDWYGGLPRQVSVFVPVQNTEKVEEDSFLDQKPENVNERPFKIKVRVSLDLRQMNPLELSSGNELSQEIASLYS